TRNLHMVTCLKRKGVIVSLLIVFCLAAAFTEATNAQPHMAIAAVQAQPGTPTPGRPAPGAPGGVPAKTATQPPEQAIPGAKAPQPTGPVVSSAVALPRRKPTVDQLGAMRGLSLAPRISLAMVLIYQLLAMIVVAVLFHKHWLT